MVSESYIKKRKEISSTIEIINRRLSFYSSRSNKFSALRLAVFVTGLALTIYSFTSSGVTGWAVLIVFLVVFGLVVHLHNKLLEGIRRLGCYLKIQEEDRARSEIDWERLPGFHTEMNEGLDFIERDLDLYGGRSLHCLIDNTVSDEGSDLLRKKLHGDFPGKDVLIQRQNLVKELAALGRMRKRFLLRAKLSSRKKLSCSKTIVAIRDDSIYRTPGVVIGISALLVTSLFVSLILTALGLINGPVLTFMFANLFLYFSFAGKVNKSLERVSEIEPHVTKLHSLISILGETKLRTGSEVAEHFPDFFVPDSELNQSFSRLRRISAAASYRENSILRILLNAALPYDFVVQRMFATEASRVSSMIESWLSKLNELECLMALANFAELNPDYSYSEIDDRNDNTLEANEIVHPLMNRGVRRPNSFSLEIPKEIVIITGSNMSGKSTFLRTVGINLCLAYSGAPSACRLLKVSAFELFTCIRVSDSVFDGISYFYAEVKRLRALIDIVSGNGKHRILFFIDEIFKGTNNRERLKGSISFLRNIASMNCTGFVTTHDLELVSLSDSLDPVRNFHFRESIHDGEMTFEYKIYPGPCPTTNALEIMRLNGLPVDE